MRTRCLSDLMSRYCEFPDHDTLQTKPSDGTREKVESTREGDSTFAIEQPHT